VTISHHSILNMDAHDVSDSEPESESDAGSIYAPSSSCEDDQWYSEALREQAYSDLDYEDDATDSIAPASSRDLTDTEGDDDDEGGKEPGVKEISKRLSDLATGQASTMTSTDSSKRPRATSCVDPPASQKRKKCCHNSSPAPTPFSKIVDGMEGNQQRIGKGPWVDRLLRPCVFILIDQLFSLFQFNHLLAQQ
jgi:hypothetical protein